MRNEPNPSISQNYRRLAPNGTYFERNGASHR